ncbi:MAG: hypothetical protein ACK5EA_13775, partial [Planctomycetaceae bacterium]
MHPPAILRPPRGHSAPGLCPPLVRALVLAVVCGCLTETAWGQRRPAARPRPQRAPAAPVEEAVDAAPA